MTEIANELQRLVEDINTGVPQRPSSPKANGNGEPADVGVENIKRRASCRHNAARCVRDGATSSWPRQTSATRDLSAQQFANAASARRALASSFEAGFARAASVAQSMAMTRT